MVKKPTKTFTVKMHWAKGIFVGISAVTNLGIFTIYEDILMDALRTYVFLTLVNSSTIIKHFTLTVKTHTTK